MPWTTENMETLRQMWADGASASKIGEVVGKTRNAVIGKVHRLKLTPRQRTSSVKHDKPRTRSRKARPPTLPTRPLPTSPTVVSEYPVSLMELRPRHCRFPLWNATEHTGLFCGDPATVGPYCQEHARACFTSNYAQRIARPFWRKKSVIMQRLFGRS
jgi:GcrA cell cycle regulator